jgi:transcriptional regulator with XRE-family HTH domain
MAAHHPPTRIRELRQAVGVSATELGKMTGILQSGISRMETGKAALTLDILFRIAHALQVEPADLIGREHDNTYFAVVRGYLSGDLAECLAGPPYALLPIPLQLSAGTPPLKAFGREGGGWFFAEERYPQPADDGREFIVHFRSGSNRERLEVRTFETSQPPGRFSSVAGPIPERWLSLGDKRIKDFWRVAADFTVRPLTPHASDGLALPIPFTRLNGAKRDDATV